MSYDDFCRCTPSEYYHVWKAWYDLLERSNRAEWERVRSMCLCTLQPHTKKHLTANDVMSFTWDREPDDESKKNRPKLTHEEEMERYRRAKERFGLR